MNRIATRVLAGSVCIALASSVGVASASAADATLVLKESPTPVVSTIDGLVVNGMISATASVPGAVAFSAAGTVIKGCEAVATSTTAPFVATCTSWQPTASGPVALTAVLTPTDTTLAKVNASLNGTVGHPVNESSVQDGISVYADTVNASSTPVSFTSKGDANPYLQNGGCLLMSQFQQGQMIVFRVYANDANHGGAAVTGQNATMNIKIAGWDTPVAMSYSSHGPTAFWAGALATGTSTSGKYSQLGSIQYSINMALLDKPAVTKEIVVNKFVKVINAKTKKAVKVNGAYVWKPVKVKQPVIVTPAVVAKTLTFTPAAWAAAVSTLTLSAKA